MLVLDGFEDAKRALEKTGAIPEHIPDMAAKGVHRLVIVDGIEPWAANIIKQEILGRGGEAALARGLYYLAGGTTSAILMGTLHQLDGLCQDLSRQARGLPAVAKEIKRALEAFDGQLRPLKVGARAWDFGERAYIMGILNTTPDSFYDGGRYRSLKQAVARAKEMVLEGADIIDVGGESSRPGSDVVPEDEERRRVVPVIKELVQEIDIPVSIDTYKWEVAQDAVEAGAVMINDITGLEDRRMLKVAAESKCAVVVMHMKGRPKTMQVDPEYESVMAEISEFLRERTDRAERQGIRADKILIDPGIGFGKTLRHNLEILTHLSELKSQRYPILLGPSRKSFIGEILKVPAEERLEGTIAAVVKGMAQGANVLRVHDVGVVAKVVRMTDAMMRPGRVVAEAHG